MLVRNPVQEPRLLEIEELLNAKDFLLLVGTHGQLGLLITHYLSLPELSFILLYHQPVELFLTFHTFNT